MNSNALKYLNTAAAILYMGDNEMNNFGKHATANMKAIDFINLFMTGKKYKGYTDNLYSKKVRKTNQHYRKYNKR